MLLYYQYSAKELAKSGVQYQYNTSFAICISTSRQNVRTYNKASWDQATCIRVLRTTLCWNQTSWEMKIFNPLSNFTCSKALRRGCTEMQHSCCHGNNGCLFEAWGLIFIQKRSKKRVKCLSLYLKLNTLL